MTDEQIEHIVLLISNGKNKYADIRNADSKITEEDIRFCSIPGIGNAKKLFILNKFVGKPFRYHFSPDDEFVLTESGENLLYKLRKEMAETRRFYIALSVNIAVLILTILGFVSG